MILNKFVVIYYLFLFCSFALGLLGVAVGLNTILSLQLTIAPETRQKLENRLYLVSSALFIGACIRVVMIPLWFIMLQSLIPLIPGAMCLAGVHIAVPIYSWSASSMKLVLPLFYFTWITITMVDKKIMEQPFLKFRHFLLIPLIIFIFAEACLDLQYLLSLKSVNVTCCTALFDFSDGTVPEIFTESHWYFVILFCMVLLLQSFLMMIFQNRKTVYILIAVCSSALFITLPLSLHSQLSPLILDAPFHHCIFCLLQISMPALAGTFLLLMAIYLSFAYGLIGFVGHQKDILDKIAVYLIKIRLTSLILYALGVILLLIPTVIQLIQMEGDL